MGYFKKFDKIKYDNQDAVNILLSVLPSRLDVDKMYVYQNYIIANGETPESISDKIYKDAKLYWTILVVNSIVNPYNEWPIDDSVLEKWVSKKYKNQDLMNVSYYFDNRINRVCDDVDDAHWRTVDNSNLPYYIIPKTIIQYEKEKNEIKRSIVVINPRYIHQFVESYEKAIEGK